MFAQEFLRVRDKETFQILLETPFHPLKTGISIGNHMISSAIRNK